MHFALLIYESPQAFQQRCGPDAAAYWSSWAAYSGALKAQTTGGACLKHPDTAIVVTQADGARRIHDGSYAATGAQLGGFILFEADSLHAALHWADRCPAAQDGAVELRPVHPMIEFAETLV